VVEAVLVEARRVLREELMLPFEARPEHDLLTDLQLDSVGILTLVVGLENRFRIALAEEETAAARTLGELVRLVARRASTATATPTPTPPDR